ncbi:carbonic anhydrase [Bacteroidota bacterium]
MKIYATVINCYDGRIQLAVNEYIKTKYLIDYVDMKQSQALLKCTNRQVINNIKERVDISIKKQILKYE